MLAGSELAPNWFGASSDFGAGSEPVAPNQLRTS